MSGDEQKILAVDDEPFYLSLLSRHLEKEGFSNVETAANGLEALDKMRSDGFDLALLDIEMPEMDGIAVLEAMKSDMRLRDIPVIMISGVEEMDSIVKCIELGAEDYLHKPFNAVMLRARLNTCLEKKRLRDVERELLEQTLAGSVKVLVDMLSMVDPEAYGKVTKLREWARQIAGQMNLPQAWKLEMAVMLSRIGWVAIPAEIQAKVHAGQKLTQMEQAMIREIPETGKKWIANIPRLKPVAEIVYYQDKCFDGAGFPDDAVAGENIPIESRILKVLNDLAAISFGRNPGEDAFRRLQSHAQRYDPAILRAVQRSLTQLDTNAEEEELYENVELPLSLLTADQTLLSDIETEDGHLILARDQRITETQLVKLRNIGRIHDIKEPIRVLRRLSAKASAAEERE